MKKKLLNWFWLTTLATLKEVENRNKEYQKLISDLTTAISQYEEKPEPSVEFSDYKPEEKRTGFFNKELFDEWYSIYCRNQYQAFQLRQLSKHPHLLNAFMMEFSSFDWESVRSYMEETNWYWGNKLVSPTINELKDCVITLIHSGDFDKVGSGWSSGGFTVELYYENCEAICKIKFDKEK
jgi:hypothetical protein